jgi:hypothetical protein
MLGVTWKLDRVIPESRNTPGAMQKRREYAEKFSEICSADMSRIVYLDEFVPIAI